MRSGLFYEWVGDLILVRLPDGAEIEGILMEVRPPWILLQEQGVLRSIQTDGGVVVTRAFDRANPYNLGHLRAAEMVRQRQQARKRREE